MPSERLVITGMGVVSALGKNLDEFEKKLFAASNGVQKVSLFDSESVRAKFAAEVKGYAEKDFFSDKQLPYFDRYAQFAVVSAREAVKRAGLDFTDKSLQQNTAVLIGTGAGGLSTQDEGYKRLYKDGGARLHPFTVPKLIPSSAASLISLEFGVTGPAIGITSACSSSGHAMAQAAMMLCTGQAEVALVGGAEAPINFGTVKAWEAMRVLAKQYCQPFSLKRGGTILGEGAGTLVLETLSHANARSAPILAELVGYGMSSDAYHAVQPSLEGPCLAMSKALQSANITPECIDYLNAHGTGTLQNDSTETKAVKAVFGVHANSLSISSTKSMHGHTLGAASAIESIASLIALKAQCAPPTINFVEGDEHCDLDYIPNHARNMNIDHVLSNSFAFGGLNVSLVYKRI